jgi:isochorismate pyruvate lyase
MKKPVECTNIDEIRNEIDAIDKQIIELLGKRLKYVTEIVRFKKDEEDILAKKR